VDEIMARANRKAVREGLAWSAGVAMAGLIGALVYRRVWLKPDAASGYDEGPSWMI
jgi:hypothetical protein